MHGAAVGGAGRGRRCRRAQGAHDARMPGAKEEEGCGGAGCALPRGWWQEAGGRSSPCPGQGPGQTKDGDKGGANRPGGVGAGPALTCTARHGGAGRDGAVTAASLPAGTPPRYGNGVGNRAGGPASPVAWTELPALLQQALLRLRRGGDRPRDGGGGCVAGERRGPAATEPPPARSSRRRGALGPPPS